LYLLRENYSRSCIQEAQPAHVTTVSVVGLQEDNNAIHRCENLNVTLLKVLAQKKAMVLVVSLQYFSSVLVDTCSPTNCCL